MATIRRAGFGSVFEVENETVGIGTTGTATNTLQVLGDIESSDATLIGLSTLTTYQGFVDKDAKFGKAVIDVESKAGTLGNIVIEGDVTVSSASTFCSSLNQLTLTDSFSVPTGNTDSRIHCQTAGSMRFNEDLGTLEFYTGDVWKTVNSFRDVGNRGRAIIAGGENDPSGTDFKIIEYIQTSTLGNAIGFGDLTNTNMQNPMGLSNSIRALFGGGNTVDTINYITIASTGNGIDFGDLTSARPRGSGLASSVRGIFVGGNPGVNIMDYVEIMTLGNALDFGDLSFTGRGPSSTASPTRGIITNDFSSNADIDLISIQSKGNAIEFGKDMYYGGYGANGGASTGTRGVWMGGYASDNPKSPSQNLRRTTAIRGVEFSSGGNATEYGDLVSASYAVYNSATGTKNRGFCFGGYDPAVTLDATNTIQFMNIQSSGDAQDFGDLTVPRYSISSACDSHGGLGGF